MVKLLNITITKLCLFGRDENVSKMDVDSIDERRLSTRTSTNKKLQSGRPIEKLSLVDVNHENLSLVDVDQ